MEFLFVIVVAAATFGVCFLADKGFTKLFRNQSQHYSGLSVRLNKKYAVAGTVLGVMGIGAIVTGVTENKALLVGGIIVTLLGVVLILYYMTFGIFYDKESFLYTSFGKKSLTYRYSQICGQQLYIIQGGNIVVELHMNDGKALQVQLHLFSHSSETLRLRLLSVILIQRTTAIFSRDTADLWTDLIA